MRHALLALSLVALACGGEPDALDTSPPLEVDRTPGPVPSGIVVELSLDGGDTALAELVLHVPPVAERAAIPTHVSVLLDGLLDTPTEIGSRVAEDSPLRLVMARIDGELRSAVVVRLDEPVPPSARTPGGPRGADRVGTSAAVDDRIAVVTDDPAMLDHAFAYLAYTALTRESQPGAVVVRVPATTMATTLRTFLADAVVHRRTELLASIAGARAAHDRPPDVGDPEAVVTSLAESLIARIGLLPDLGEATVTLAPTASGLALDMEASVTEGSPLAEALEGRTPVATALAAAMPTGAALVVATGTTAAARTASAGELAEALGAIGGERISVTERASLDEAARAISALRGDQGALALGATDANGLFVVGLTRGGSGAPPPTPWGRALPWTSGLLGALVHCTPAPPRSAAGVASICGGTSLAWGIDGDVRSDAVGREAAALGSNARSAALEGRVASSPDLARDLAALSPTTFAIALLRPLPALPVLSALGGAPAAGLPRGDGTVVLALAHDSGRLRVSLRASTSAMSDLDVLRRLFADETDSE